MTSTTWLSVSEQRAWRNYLAVTTKLSAALHRHLQSEFDLSLQDFDVLVQLSEADQERLRASDLAESLQWGRSRLSHHIKRMEGRGLVSREECADDRRGAFVVLAAAGREAVDAAAPAHVVTVRNLVFDALTGTDVAAFTAVTEKILARLADDHPQPVSIGAVRSPVVGCGNSGADPGDPGGAAHRQIGGGSVGVIPHHRALAGS